MSVGTVQLNPYLNFEGSTREALEFYQRALGGTLDLQTFGESPIDMPEEDKDKIMHGRLDADGLTIMAADAMPGKSVTNGQNVSLSLMGADGQTLTKAFNALAEGGEVTLPLAEQFWGDTFGMLIDKFGIQWMVNVTKG